MAWGAQNLISTQRHAVENRDVCSPLGHEPQFVARGAAHREVRAWKRLDGRSLGRVGAVARNYQ